jgi:hypothetical protein
MHWREFADVQIKTVKTQKHLYCLVFTKAQPKSLAKSRFFGFLFLLKNNKTKKCRESH